MNPIQPPPPMTYQHLRAENEYLKHNVAYHQHVSQYNYNTAQSNFHDAQRWQKFKQLLEQKEGKQKVTELEGQIDEALGKKK